MTNHDPPRASVRVNELGNIGNDPTGNALTPDTGSPRGAGIQKASATARETAQTA